MSTRLCVRFRLNQPGLSDTHPTFDISLEDLYEPPPATISVSSARSYGTFTPHWRQQQLLPPLLSSLRSIIPVDERQKTATEKLSEIDKILQQASKRTLQKLISFSTETRPNVDTPLEAILEFFYDFYNASMSDKNPSDPSRPCVILYRLLDKPAELLDQVILVQSSDAKNLPVSQPFSGSFRHDPAHEQHNT